MKTKEVGTTYKYRFGLSYEPQLLRNNPPYSSMNVALWNKAVENQYNFHLLNGKISVTKTLKLYRKLKNGFKKTTENQG